MGGATEGYKPGEEFEEDINDPLVDISLTDSTELWLIQWPVKQLKPSDFHGKELKLRLHRDGKLGSLETSSGKSYDMVTFAAQEPDATVFLPTSLESKVVGKISRRVCLRRFPEPDEFEPPSFHNPNLSSQKGSGRSSSHRSTVLRGTESRDTFAFTQSTEERILQAPQPSRKKRHEDSGTAEGASRDSRPDSHITDTSLPEQSHGDKSKKKKKKKNKIADEE